MQIHEDHDRRQSHINEPFVSNNIVASASSSSSFSSSSLSCHSLFHSTQQHDAGYNYHQEDDNYACNQSGSSSSSSSSLHEMIKNKNENKLWEKEYSEDEKNNYPVKWMSSKMRLKYNPTKVEEDHEKRSSNNMMSCSYNNTNINNNNVMRVCSDCSTTKTPLWRSGPKGPKSLCNACGIRQRKARRASGMAVVSDEPPPHMKEIKNTTTTNNNSVGKINYNASSTIQLRKRFMKMTTSAAGSTSIGAGTPSIYNGPKKIEEFLIHFSNNLAASHLRVCPEDEKDAAILLMALSSGLFHTN